jgi:uncharacterized protein YbjT (DUF2867 family)
MGSSTNGVDRVLVVGATGQLGRVITRKLTDAGMAVRALARRADRLAELDPRAEAAAVDLLDVPQLTEACRGVTEIVATANNNMGVGANSPTRIDLAGYQNLCAAARNTGVRRIIYVSYRGVDRDAPVDIFRLKWYIEDAIRRSGVPHVMLRPSAFMDIWIDELLLKDMRNRGTARLFGDGNRVANYIAIDDVAEFAVKVVSRPELTNEIVDVGGPSTVSQAQLVSLLEQRFHLSVKRRHLPLALLRLLPPVIRPFNELAARLVSLGYYSAACSEPFEQWSVSAERFGVHPRSVEDYIRQLN